MSTIKVKIQSIEDAKEGVNGLGVTADKIEETKDFTAVIMEGATQSGKIGVALAFKMADGSYKVHQCTEGAFEMLIGAFNGAKARFYGS